MKKLLHEFMLIEKILLYMNLVVYLIQNIPPLALIDA